MSKLLKTLSKNRIEYATHGVVTGEAYRVDPQHDWFIGIRVADNGIPSIHGKMKVIAVVPSYSLESTQRKAVMGILRAFHREEDEDY